MSEKKYRNPIPTIDAIIHNEKNQVLFIKRKNDPFKNHLSLPGGFVNYGERIEDALRREVKEETSLNIEPLEILGVYSDPNRDPRGHIMSTVFVCLIMDNLKGKAGDDASDICWVSLNDIKNNTYAFDHKMIIEDYLRWRVQNSTHWSSKNR
ncbi:MAG: NUDIX hydrolase [Nitrosopumilus sp.]|nr:NUDIX hydrolase [Nitrosopumilus sp.]